MKRLEITSWHFRIHCMEIQQRLFDLGGPWVTLITICMRRPVVTLSHFILQGIDILCKGTRVTQCLVLMRRPQVTFSHFMIQCLEILQASINMRGLVVTLHRISLKISKITFRHFMMYNVWRFKKRYSI